MDRWERKHMDPDREDAQNAAPVQTTIKTAKKTAINKTAINKEPGE